MDFNKTSTAEAYARKIRKLRKKDLDRMPGMNAKQMNPVGVDPDGKRLDTWKEIAVYLGRAVRTAQRWQKREGLPVHRLFHAKASTVYAFKHEVDVWLGKRRWAAGERPVNRESTEHQVDWPHPRARRGDGALAELWSWLQNAAGMGSMELSYGEHRLHLRFYVQFRGGRRASPRITRLLSHLRRVGSADLTAGSRRKLTLIPGPSQETGGIGRGPRDFLAALRGRTTGPACHYSFDLLRAPLAGSPALRIKKPTKTGPSR